MEVETRGHLRSFVDFAELLDDPVETLNRIASQLHIELPSSPASNRTKLEDFLEPTLNHGDKEATQFGLSRDAVDLFEVLKELQSGDSESTSAKMDSLKRDADDLSSAITHTSRLFLRQQEQNRVLRSQVTQVGQLKSVNERQAAQIHQLEEQLRTANENYDVRFATLAADIQSLEAALEEQNQRSRGDREAVQRILDGLFHDFSERFERMEESSNASTADIGALRSEFGGHRKELESLVSTSLDDERTAAKVEFDQQRREFLELLDTQSEESASNRATLADLVGQLRRVEHDVASATVMISDQDSRFAVGEDLAKLIDDVRRIEQESTVRASEVVQRLGIEVSSVRAEVSDSQNASQYNAQELSRFGNELEALKTALTDQGFANSKALEAAVEKRLSEATEQLSSVVRALKLSYNEEIRRLLQTIPSVNDLLSLENRVEALADGMYDDSDVASEAPIAQSMADTANASSGTGLNDHSELRVGLVPLPSFPQFESPLVSIVIPAFNHTGVTLECLRAIEANPPEVPFEVIVGNDCSTDPEFNRLRDIVGLAVADTQENGGFGHNCNNAAAQARGEFLYFLNNDTQIRADAIDSLVRTFETFPKTGIAGSKLIFPDGTVQDGGGIIWQDGSAWNYGRGRDPQDPVVNYCRATDYVAGASLMIRKQLFNEFGGFDDLFAPAYYEDTDLCMKVKERGLEVRYQPRSEVVHNEGTSYGTDVSQEGKHNQIINAEKFFERWKGTLAQHRPNAVEPEREKERGIDLRVLIIDARMLTPDKDSGSLRMSNICRILTRMGHKVTFVPKNLQAMEHYGADLQEQGVEVIAIPHVASIEEFLTDRGNEFDVVLLSRVEVVDDFLEPARRLCPDAQVIFDTVDLHFLRERRELEVTGASTLPQSYLETYEKETTAIRESDATIVVSLAEVELLKAEVPEAAVYWVSNTHEETPSNTPPAGRADLLFVGGFEHPPNLDGVEWFVDEVFPLVLAKQPDVKLHIIGSKAGDAVYDLARRNSQVVVHGFVEDLTPFYNTSRVSIAPLRYGAGVKGKVTQALARGLPVVGTSVAIEGMPGDTKAYSIQVDNPQDFANGVSTLLTDSVEWQKQRDAGLNAIEEYFSFAAIRSQLEELLQLKPGKVRNV